MRKFRIFLPLFLTAIITSSCGGQGGSAKNPVNEETPIYSEKTLHNVNVKERDLPFFVDGKTDYVMVIPAENEYAEKAALLLKQHIGSATGGNINYVTYSESMSYNSESKYIVFNVPALSNAAGVTKTEIDLKVTGYQIATKDKSVFMFVNHNYGYQQVAYSFLKNVIGYDRISKNITLYNRDAKTLPEMDIVEIPDFQIRTQSNQVDINYSYQTGFLLSTEVFFSNKEIKFVHNSTTDSTSPGWIPSSLKSNPECKDWFGDGDCDQLCFTAHGNKEHFDSMVDYAFERFKVFLAEDPDCTRYSFTIMDNRNSCGCSACAECVNKYGALSATAIIFLNAVDTKVQNYLQQIADATSQPKRQMEIVFFAYNAYEKAPTKLVNGKYEPTAPEVKCHDTVSVYIAPIRANYCKSVYDGTNSEMKDTIESWTAICSSINFWLYETNFQEYLYPYNSFAGMANTYRFVSNMNASYMYNEGQHNQGACTGFGRFKEYFNQIAMFDVNSSYSQIVDHFFSEYFKDAKDVMLKYFYELQDHCNYLLDEYYGSLTGSIYDQIAKNSAYWPKKLLDRWVGYIEEGYSLIEHYKKTDIALYNILHDNLCLESIFPRYATLSHHSTKFTTAELAELRTNFYYEAVSLGVTQIREGTPFSSLKTTWNIE